MKAAPPAATRNFYDFLQDSQCYATGGYGPAERFVFADGALGESLESRLDSFEAPCCTWAAFKLAEYLIMFSGAAKYGDWMERLLYNAIGAALPIVENGKHFYYANYHLGAGMKIYSRNNYTCCSGTYFQNAAGYQNLICFAGDDALCVNLYPPSTVTRERPTGAVKLTQVTNYPEAEAISMDPAVFQYAGQEQSPQRDDFMPLYRFGEMATYRLNFDPELRHVLW